MKQEQSALALNTPIVPKPAPINIEFGESKTQAAMVQQHLVQLSAEMSRAASFLTQAVRNPHLQTSTPQAVLARLAEINEQITRVRIELRPHAIRATAGLPS
jgi:hypothetical protein